MSEPIENEVEVPGVKLVAFDDELQANFLSYAEYVIRDRAIPDVRDGLKPVHRRILWTMWDMGCKHNIQPKKSARVVGEVIGKYHPHGDSAAYGSMVRLAQPFSVSVPLVNGKGNFGSIDGHPAAAQRYTEAKLSAFGEHVLFSDINDATVEFTENYTGEFKEPTVLPARIPLILLTTSNGIAVGMATNILPYNLGEVCDGLIAMVKNSTITQAELQEIIPAPDYPLGGIVHGGNGIAEIINNGRGSVKFRSSADFESTANGKNAVIIKSVPFQQNKSELIQEMAAAVRDGKIEGISEIRDESSKKGIRICVELKKGVNHQLILNNLYNVTKLQTSHAMNSVAIMDSKPRTVGVFDILKNFIDFRRGIIIRRTESQKNKAESRKEIVEAILIAIANKNDAIEIISDEDDPIKVLISKLNLNQRQADHIFNMPVRRFSKQDGARLAEELNELNSKITWADGVLSSSSKVDAIIIEETEEIHKKFAEPRKTIVVKDFDSINVKDTVKEQDVVLVFLSDNKIKSTPIADYRLQRRKGRGASGVKSSEGEHPIFVETVNTHDDVMLFTNKGNRYKIHAYDIPPLGKGIKPQKISTYIPLFRDDERVVSVIKSSLSEDESLVILSAGGLLKKQSARTVTKSRDKTTLFYPIDKGGEVIGAIVAKKDDEIVITSKLGQVLRTRLEKIKEVKSRQGAGVKVLRLREGDEILAVSKVVSDGFILTVSKLGFAKRTEIKNFAIKRRTSTGICGCKLSGNDGLIFSQAVPPGDSETGLFVMANTGIAIRLPFIEVRETKGRSSIGTQLKKLSENEVLTTVSIE